MFKCFKKLFHENFSRCTDNIYTLYKAYLFNTVYIMKYSILLPVFHKIVIFSIFCTRIDDELIEGFCFAFCLF